MLNTAVAYELGALAEPLGDYDLVPELGGLELDVAEDVGLVGLLKALDARSDAHLVLLPLELEEDVDEQVLPLELRLLARRHRPPLEEAALDDVDLALVLPVLILLHLAGVETLDVVAALQDELVHRNAREPVPLHDIFGSLDAHLLAGDVEVRIRVLDGGVCFDKPDGLLVFLGRRLQALLVDDGLGQARWLPLLFRGRHWL